MIEIQEGKRTQYINFSNGIKYTALTYSIRSLWHESNLDLLVDPGALPPIPLRIDYEQENNPEFSLKHQPYLRSIEGNDEYSIDPPIAGSRSLPCSVLRLDAVQRALTIRKSAEFVFELIVTEEVDVQSLLDPRILQVETREGEQVGAEIVTILNHARTNFGPLPIIDFVREIGDLRTEIIWESRVYGISNQLWHIEIDNLIHPFEAQEYVEFVQRALARSLGNVFARIPLYLREQFPSATDTPLPVKVCIREIAPNVPITIRFRRRAPEQELMFPTGIAALNQLILQIHAELLRKGLPLNVTFDFQKVLSQLLRYRQSILNVPGFANPDALRTDEDTFHIDLHGRLSTSIDFGDPIYSEVGTGNSRIDLLIAGLPTELKLERNGNRTTIEIIQAYAKQAADYVARCESRVGFLVVLDGVPTRNAPTPPAVEDVLVVDVPTAAGGMTSVVGLIIRLPRSPSQFSK